MYVAFAARNRHFKIQKRTAPAFQNDEFIQRRKRSIVGRKTKGVAIVGFVCSKHGRFDLLQNKALVFTKLGII